MESNINGKYFAALVVLVFLTVFLWSVHQILSPFLIAGILLFILFGFKEIKLARQISMAIVLILLVWVLSKARGVFFPLFASFIIAYLFDPIVDFFEQKKVPRTFAVSLLLIVTFGLVITAGIFIIPGLISEIQVMIMGIPDFARDLANSANNVVVKIEQTFNVQDLSIEESWVDKIPSSLEQLFSNLLKGVLGMGSFLSQILNVVLIPVLTFYILKDYDRINNWLMSLIPKKHRSITSFYLWRFNRILGGYLRGQLIVCSVIGLLTGLGLVILQVPFAILLGVMTGVLGIIPFVGFYISLGMCILAALLSTSRLIMLVKIVSVFLIVQGLEGYVISPKIVGERVGLHPVAVIFSVLVFSVFFGFWGLIVGVPTAALIKFLIDEWKRRQKRRELLEEKSAA